MTVSVTHTFTPKTNAKSSQVNTNFGDLVNYINNLEADFTAPGNVSTADIDDFAVTSAKIANDAVTADKLRDDASVDANRAVTTDHIRDAAITAAKIATSVAGDGLSGGGGTALAVNVDSSTIEINTDTLRVKDAGITEAKLASAVTTKLGQNIGLRSRTSHALSAGGGHTAFEDVLNYSGQGRLDGITFTFTKGGSSSYEIKIVVDGLVTQTLAVSATSTGRILLNDGNSTTMFITDTGSVGKMNDLNVFFNTSILVQHRFDASNATNASTAYVQYERQA